MDNKMLLGDDGELLEPDYSLIPKPRRIQQTRLNRRVEHRPVSPALVLACMLGIIFGIVLLLAAKPSLLTDIMSMLKTNSITSNTFTIGTEPSVLPSLFLRAPVYITTDRPNLEEIFPQNVSRFKRTNIGIRQASYSGSGISEYFVISLHKHQAGYFDVFKSELAKQNYGCAGRLTTRAAHNDTTVPYLFASCTTQEQNVFPSNTSGNIKTSYHVWWPNGAWVIELQIDSIIGNDAQLLYEFLKEYPY